MREYSVSDAWINFVRKRLKSEPQRKGISLNIRHINDLYVLNCGKMAYLY